MATSAAVQRIRALPTKSKSMRSMVKCLVAADVATLLASVTIALFCKGMISGIPSWENYLRLWPFLFVFIAVFSLVGLYSGVALSPPEELRRATLSSTLVFLV